MLLSKEGIISMPHRHQASNEEYCDYIGAEAAFVLANRSL
jgi:hypothetical protein